MANSRLRYDAVLFDVDGTLVDSAPDMCRALNLSLEEIGRPPVKVTDIHDMIGGLGKGKISDQVLALTGGWKNHEEEKVIMDGFRRHYFSDLLVLTEPYPMIPELLETLYSKNIKMAACTNKNEKSAVQMIEQLGWSKYFPIVLGGDSLPTRKPEPEMLLTATDKLGVSVNNTLMVGDTISDTLAANRANMDCAFVDYGYSVIPHKELVYAHHVNEASELLELFP